MSAKIIPFKKRPSQWDSLIAHFEIQLPPDKLAHYKDLLKWLVRKEQSMSSSSLTQDFFNISNQIRFVRKRIKEINHGND